MHTPTTRFTLIVLFVLIVAACTPTAPGLTPADLPTGDAAQGSALFNASINNTPTCVSCHALDGTRGRGPGLAGYADRAASAVRDQDAAAYTLASIIDPSAHLVSGFSNIMYREYAAALSPQQIADLIAYLLTL